MRPIFNLCLFANLNNSLPLAIIPSTGEVVLLQLDGHLSPEQFEEAMDLATSGCMDLYKIMRDALDKSYGGKK